MMMVPSTLFWKLIFLGWVQKTQNKWKASLGFVEDHLDLRKAFI